MRYRICPVERSEGNNCGLSF
ncbi:MAG: hypothetical protein ACOX6D_01755 [Thermoguttaceae bacterium]